MKNIITTWDTDIGDIPEGWHLCDGADSSPLLNVPLSLIRAYRTSSYFLIPTGVITKIQFNAVTYDILSEYDNITNFRFTAQNAGYYLLAANIWWTGSIANTEHRLHVYKNTNIAGLNIARAVSTGYFSQSITDVVYLVAGDYIELKASQNSGGNLYVGYGTTFSFFSIHRLIVSDPFNSKLRLMIKL